MSLNKETKPNKILKLVLGIFIKDNHITFDKVV